MSRNPVEIVRAAVAPLNAGDIDGHPRHIDPSCMRRVAGPEQPLPLNDIRDSIYHLHGAFEDLYLNEEMVFGSDQFACARWQMQGVHVNEYMGIAPQRQEINLQSCEIYAFDADRITTVWTYGDLAQLLRQIGPVS